MRKRVISLLLLAALLVAVFAVASAQTSYPQPGNTDSNAIIQNTSTGAGEDALVLVNYYNEAGTLVYSRPQFTIEPKSVKEVKTEDEPLDAGFKGSAQISSDRPLAAVTSLRNRGVPVGDAWTQGAYNGATMGFDTIFFPTYWAFSGIVSRITVQNTESDAANIALDFYDRDGNFLGTKTDTLNAFGSKTYYAGNAADWPAGVDLEAFNDGSVTVRSTNGNLLAGASTATWPERAGAYQALTANDRGTVLYSPAQFRFKLNAADAVPTIFSALNIQNTSETTDAEGRIEYYNRDTGALDLTVNFTIPPLSALGANTWNGGSFPAATFNALGWDWDGSAKIISTNGVELVGTGITSWGTTSTGGMYALASANNAASELFMPAQYRRIVSGQWAQWSSLNLQNVGTSTISASDLTVQYIDQNGNVVKTFNGSPLFDLEPGAAIGLNTRNGGDLAASEFTSFGENFIGGIYVTAPAGSELVATSNILYSNRSSVYNGAPGN